MRRMLLVFTFTFVTLLAACYGPSYYTVEGRHEAFKTMYGRQVGLNADDPERSWLERYPDNTIGKRTLPNGNTEIERRTTSGSNCRVFYEIDPNTRTIVAWRYEGSQEDCTWIGP